MRRRTRWMFVIPAIALGVVMVAASMLIRPPKVSVPAPSGAVVPTVAVQAPSGNRRIIPFDAREPLAPDCSGSQAVPNGWQRHDFNGAAYYIVPLGQQG